MAFFMAGIPVSSSLGSTMLILETNDDKAKLFSENGDALRNPLPVKRDKTFPKAFIEGNRPVRIIVRDRNGEETFSGQTTALLFNTSQQGGSVRQERFEALKELLATKEYSISQGGTGVTTSGQALEALTPDVNVARAAIGHTYAKTTDPSGAAITDLDQLDEVGVYQLPTDYDNLANKPDHPTKANENDGVYCIVEPRGLYGLVQRVVFTKWSSLTATIPKFFMRYAFPADQSSQTREAWSDWYAWGLVPQDGVGWRGKMRDPTFTSIIRTLDRVTLYPNTDACFLGVKREDLINNYLIDDDELEKYTHTKPNDLVYACRADSDYGGGTNARYRAPSSAGVIWYYGDLVTPDEPYSVSSLRSGLVIL